MSTLPDRPGRLNLLVLACFLDRSSADRVQDVAGPLRQALCRLPDVSGAQLELCPPEDAHARLDAHFRAPAADGSIAAAIVASDSLIAPVKGRMTEVPALTELGTSLLDGFSDRLLGTVGATAWPERVCDIDRTIGFDFDDDELGEALTRTVRTLAYKAAPVSREAIHPIELRLLKTPAELGEYLRLRHRVYSIMGYFSYEVESNPTQMEVDRYDRFSIPIGAFRTDVMPHRLIGTSRVIIDENTYDDAVKNGLVSRMNLAQLDALVTDPYMSREMDRPLPFPLPVMISQPLELAYYYKAHVHFGELSRVIVDQPERGTGVSKALVDFSLEQARRLEVEQLFLECIPAHEALYHRHGFSILPGMRREVDHVFKRMIAMASPSPPLHERAAGASSSSATVQTAAPG